GDTHAVDWIRSVANEDFLSEPACCSHAVGESVNKCVDPAADVLHIEKEDVNVVEHRVGWLACFAIERMDRQTRFAIDAMTGFDHVVLDVAANSVLWAKQSSQLDVGV